MTPDTHALTATVPPSCGTTANDDASEPVDAGWPIVDELVARLAAMNEPGTTVDLAVRVGNRRDVVAVPVNGERLVIGRGAADIAVDEPMGSRRHAELWCVRGRLVLADAGSRNGTWVLRDGERLDAAAPMEVFQGDEVVTVGDAVLLRIGGG